MTWNWQQPDWPRFRWNPVQLASSEGAFLLSAGRGFGALTHLGPDERTLLMIEALGSEAVNTSAIEGEILDRDSVQSSIQRQLGLSAETRRIRPAEAGIAEMMTHLYRTASEPASKEIVFGWHKMLTRGRSDLKDVGKFRRCREPMQIVSGPIGSSEIHFEAPPASRVPKEMDAYFSWFNASAPQGTRSLPALARSGIAHLYFESIHPFEDGNGRIGRALAEKALAQATKVPSLTGLATEIMANRKSYYDALELANKHNDVTEWLLWHSEMVLRAQQRTLASIEFTIRKTRLLDRLRGKLNPRQHKALMRMLREGPAGFEGGLSAKNYTTITGATPATTTRDLSDMVEKGALTRTGVLKGTRYEVNLSS